MSINMINFVRSQKIIIVKYKIPYIGTKDREAEKKLVKDILCSVYVVSGKFSVLQNTGNAKC